MNVTLADIARAAGISSSTVSRALSAPDKVNPATAQQVRRLAKEMGYISVRSARPPGGTRTDMIGLIVPDIANPFFPPIIKAVQARANAQRRTVVIADVDEYATDEVRRAKFLAGRVDGLMIASARSSDAQLSALSHEIPLVLINRESAGVSSVAIENTAGMFEAVEHLAALGHKAISYLNGPKRSWSNVQRQLAVQEACKKAGIELIELGPFEPQVQAGARAADLVLASGATAVIAYDDLIALGVMARLNERDIRVGKDLSLIGVDDSLISGMAYPSLTTVQVPGAQAGIEAIDMLIDLIDNYFERKPRHPLQQVITVETQLIVRNSTGIAPKQSY